jgi:hypothetical protein
MLFAVPEGSNATGTPRPAMRRVTRATVPSPPDHDQVGRVAQALLPALFLRALVAHLVAGRLEKPDQALGIIAALPAGPGVVDQRDAHVICSKTGICASSLPMTTASTARA